MRWLSVGGAAFPGGLWCQDRRASPATGLQESRLGQVVLGVWGHLQGLFSVPQMHGMFGAEGTHLPVCCLISTVSMWTKNYKLLNKGFS